MQTPSSPEARTQPPLAEQAASPHYFANAMAAIGRLSLANDESQAVKVLSDAATLMGADAAAFVSFVRDDGSHESFRFLLACDPVWCLEYEQRVWYATDPWLAYALTHSEPARGYEIAPGSAQQRAVVELATKYGFRSSLIVPAPSSGGLSRVGVLCLGSNQAGFFDDAGYPSFRMLARSLAMELHEWWIARIKRELIANVHLSEEDLLLLTQERLGHGTKSICSTLQMSPTAVNSRFQRLNAKLGVPNRKAAAQLAAEYGLI